jgi:IS30 family transposase
MVCLSVSALQELKIVQFPGIGKANSQIATLVERQTRYTLLVKVKSKTTDDVVSALSRQMKKLPVLLQQSLTWDRGTEMGSHEKLSIATGIDVYFCDPQSPCPRGGLFASTHTPYCAGTSHSTRKRGKPGLCYSLR